MLPPSLNLYTPMPVFNDRAGDERLQHESPIFLLRAHMYSWGMISKEHNMHYEYMMPGLFIKNKECAMYCLDYLKPTKDFYGKKAVRQDKKLTKMLGRDIQSNVIASLKDYDCVGYKQIMNILEEKLIPYAIFLQEEYCGKEEFIYLKTQDQELTSKRIKGGIQGYLEQVAPKLLDK